MYARQRLIQPFTTTKHTTSNYYFHILLPPQFVYPINYCVHNLKVLSGLFFDPDSLPLGRHSLLRFFSSLSLLLVGLSSSSLTLTLVLLLFMKVHVHLCHPLNFRINKSLVYCISK